MLILARSEGQSIQIGDNIRITITDVGKSQVRIGIEAPRDLVVLRSEIVESIAAENRRSLGDARAAAAGAAALLRQLGTAPSPGEAVPPVVPVRPATLAGRQRLRAPQPARSGDAGQGGAHD